MAGDTALKLQYIYGYHGDRCRNNLVFTPEKELVYFLAAAGIVYNHETNQQRFFLHHTDDIISLALHPDGTKVATGQLGKNPQIIVWDVHTMEPLAILKGLHQRGVCALSFDGQGDHLLSIGMEDDHLLGVWKWKTGKVVASAKGHSDRIFDVAVHPETGLIVTAGIKHVKFWTLNGPMLTSKKGIFGKVGEIQTMLAICQSAKHTYTTSMDGDVYVWQGNQLVTVHEKLHKDAIFCIQRNPAADAGAKEAFCTAGRDGVLRMWTEDFHPLESSDVSPVCGPRTCIRAIGWFKHEVAVGTKAGQIAICDDTAQIEPCVFMEGHGEGELWGLAVHPGRNIFATVSDDERILLWNAMERKCEGSAVLGGAARSVAFSEDAAHLAVGMKSGELLIVRASNPGTVVARMHHRREEISDLKYSPCGRYLAVGSHDNYTDIHDVKQSYKRVGCCKGHSSFITHIDWSKDSKYLMSNSGDYEILFWNMPSGRRNMDIDADSAHTDYEWDTKTTVLGDDVSGIWPRGSDKTDVNAVDRSHGGQSLIAGDDFGKLRLFPYPANSRKNVKVYRGHSSHVTNARFLQDDLTAVSVGGADMAVFQWVHQGAEEYDDDVDSDCESDTLSEADSEEEMEMARLDAVKAIDHAPEGKKFSAARRKPVAVEPKPKETPEEKASRIPHFTGEADPSAPGAKIVMEHVFGFRGHDTRMHCYYGKGGAKVATACAALGVVQDMKTREQQFNDDHDDDIISLAMHPHRELVATGQVGKAPKVVVWSVEDPTEPVAELTGFHKRGINTLAFSSGSGDMLLTCGLDDDHTVAVWKWSKGKLVASAAGGGEPILAAAFNPNDSNEFITVGKKMVRFWKVAGCGLVFKKGLFGKGARKTMLSCAYNAKEGSHNVYTGANTGKVYEWDWSTHKLTKTFTAHNGPVYGMTNDESTGGYITSGKDGFIKRWDARFKARSSGPATLKTDSSVRSVDALGPMILAGTRSGTVLEFDMRNENGPIPRVLLAGHGDGELWGLAAHPSENSVFATTSDDGTLQMWDCARKDRVAWAALPKDNDGRALAFHPSGQHLACGTMGGGVIVYGVTKQNEGFDLQVIEEFRHRREEVSALTYSPCGQYLAVGSHDNFVDIHDVKQGYKRVGVCKGHSSFITHVDWSVDSQHLVTNSGDYDQLFWQAPRGNRVVDAKKIQAIQWATWSGVLGDEVEGIWPADSDKTDINSTDRSHSGNVLATADDFGDVKLFPFPAIEHARFKGPYIGHSSHVTCVRFLANDRHLVSVGGLDGTAIVWRAEGMEPVVAGNYQIAAPPVDSDYDSDPSDDEIDTDIEDEKEIATKSTFRRPPKTRRPKAAPAGDDSDSDDEATISAGADRQTMVAPSTPTRSDIKQLRSMLKTPEPEKFQRQQAGSEEGEPTQAPTISLVPEYAYGYRGRNVRANLGVTQTGDIVFPAAGLGVVLNPRTNTQEMFRKHTDDILCLATGAYADETGAVHTLCATGQVGADAPKVCVWDPRSPGTPLAVLETSIHERGISAVGFSADGTILATVGLENDHNVALWKWTKGRTMAVTKGSTDKIFTIRFCPDIGAAAGGDEDSSADLTRAVTCGVKHISFWRMAGNSLVQKDGIFGKVGPVQTMLDACWSTEDANQVYTAAQGGEIYAWDASTRKLRKVIAAHEQSCNTLIRLDTSKSAIRYVSGGRDGVLRFWSPDFEQQLSKISIDVHGGVRSIAEIPGQDLLAVGTSLSSVLQIDVHSKDIVPHVMAHGPGELWGLAAHPTKQVAATGSDDGTVRTWDLAKRTIIASARPFSTDAEIRSVAFSSDGRYLALGTMSGTVALLDADTLELIKKRRYCKEEIDDVKFSPDGHYLAAASHDNWIDIYDVTEPNSFKRKARCKGHTSFVTHIDWSTCSKYLRSNSGDYETLHWKLPRGAMEHNRQTLNKLEWHTMTCVLEDDVEGIWPAGSDKTDVNSCDRSHSGAWIATGDDFGRVSLFRYPATLGVHGKNYFGHSSHVTRVCFSAGDIYLLSVGGNDQTFVQV